MNNPKNICESDEVRFLNKDYFDALEEVYYWGGIGNTLLRDFYDNRIEGGSESQFARLAVYMEWRYGIKSTKQIETRHIYELLDLFRLTGFKDSTLKGYISAYRHIYSRNRHLLSDDFEMPSNEGFSKWSESKVPPK